jgi:hypothetical protein
MAFADYTVCAIWDFSLPFPDIQEGSGGKPHETFVDRHAVINLHIAVVGRGNFGVQTHLEMPLALPNRKAVPEVPAIAGE